MRALTHTQLRRSNWKHQSLSKSQKQKIEELARAGKEASSSLSMKSSFKSTMLWGRDGQYDHWADMNSLDLFAYKVFN